MTAERITCPNCGRSTIKGRFCIYCGYTLEQPEKQVAVPTVPAPAGTAQLETLPAEEGVEERKLADQIASVYSWWIKLMDLVINKESPPDVFAEIYNEYHTRIAALNDKRLSEVKKTEERIDELSARLEQMRVRHEIGEIPDRQYITQKLEIDREIGRLRPKLAVLQNPFNMRLSELPDFQAGLMDRLERFKKDGADLGVEQETREIIIRDLEYALETLDVLLQQHRKLKRELDKLEIRYKIGELKQDEYLSRKQKLEREMEFGQA